MPAQTPPTPAPVLTRYADLRASVQDGDTIAVLAHGAYGLALRLGQMGPYGHVGIVRSVTIEGVTRMMVIEESGGGGKYTPLSHYQTHLFDVYPAPTGIDGRAASGQAVVLLEGLAEYDWPEIWRLVKLGTLRALARLIGARLPSVDYTPVTAWRDGVICSALVTSAYVNVGWQPAGRTPWPTALVQLLGPARASYRPAPPPVTP